MMFSHSSYYGDIMRSMTIENSEDICECYHCPLQEGIVSLGVLQKLLIRKQNDDQNAV